jgi:hypothetical protein
MRYTDPQSHKGFEFYCQSDRWRRLSAEQLDALILFRRRSAVTEQHGYKEWALTNRMRKRLARLTEAVR